MLRGIKAAMPRKTASKPVVPKVGGAVSRGASSSSRLNNQKLLSEVQTRAYGSETQSPSSRPAMTTKQRASAAILGKGRDEPVAQTANFSDRPTTANYVNSLTAKQRAVQGMAKQTTGWVKDEATGRYKYVPKTADMKMDPSGSMSTGATGSQDTSAAADPYAGFDDAGGTGEADVADAKKRMEEAIAAADSARARGEESLAAYNEEQAATIQKDYMEKQKQLKANLNQRGILDSSTATEWETQALGEHDTNMRVLATKGAETLANLVADNSMSRADAELKYQEFVQGIKESERQYKIQLAQLRQSDASAEQKAAYQSELNDIKMQNLQLQYEKLAATEANYASQDEARDVQNRIAVGNYTGVDDVAYGGTGERALSSIRQDNKNALAQGMEVAPGGNITGNYNAKGELIRAQTANANASAIKKGGSASSSVKSSKSSGSIASRIASSSKKSSSAVSKGSLATLAKKKAKK